MRKALFVTFIIFLLLHMADQARSYSILTGTVIQLHRRSLTVKSDDGGIVPVRVGRKTVYPNGTPAVGDRVKVEYSIVRGAFVGFSVAIVENAKEIDEPQKKVLESQTEMPSSLPPEVKDFAGKWEGSWDNNKDYGFTLTIRNVNSEAADVKYESKDLQSSKKANLIPGEIPRIEWMINSIVNPEGPFVTSTTVGSKDYFAILSESIAIYYSFEIQKDGTLKGSFDSRRHSALGTSRIAVMRRVN